MRLRADVTFLSTISPPRNARNIASLNKAADYVANEFTRAGCVPERQPFHVGARTYQNVICSFGPKDAPLLVIGAHYDVFADLPGADDNASGVAGILELARRIGRRNPSLAHRIDLVAYTLEEPPFFRTQHMGSFKHAKSLADSGAEVKLMISVEMIGYFSDLAESQKYPTGLLNLIYPDTGNFIGVVGLLFGRGASSRVKELMAAASDLPVQSIAAPRILTGVDFSDHLNYWEFDMPAVMVTDTAFFRNPNYHQPTDTPDTLDYERMALVVTGLYKVATEF